MNITDPKALKILNSIKMPECRESIKTYPDVERYGMNDLMVILHEVEYYKYFYEESGTTFNADLNHAKWVLKKTKYGKFIPLDMVTLKPVYSQLDIECAKNIVSEYVQLKALIKKLQMMV